MRKFKKSLLALATASALLFSMTACGSDTSGTDGTANNTGTGSLPRITLYPEAANLSSGVVGGWKGEHFASLGFEVDVWAYSDEKTNAILASGDLPDVMYVSAANLDTMIQGGMLLNLDDYLDQMPNLKAFTEIEPALNYIREYRSADTGSVYALPLSVGDFSTKYAIADSTERNALKILWDVYEDIGSPEINDTGDLIDIMEQMMEAKPTDEDGSPYYGTVLNNGSDTAYWASMVMYYRWQGYTEQQLAYLLEGNYDAGTYTSILSKDSLYYEGLQWYNEAYNRGVLDPDSISNDRATQKVKLDNSYTMVPSGYLPGWAPNYLEYYIPGTKVHYSYASTFGDSRSVIAINANTKNLDAALAFVDMLASPDSLLITRNGPDGGLWESDENGVATLTEAGTAYLNEYSTTDNFPLASGEVAEIWNTPFIVNTGVPTSYTDPDGNPRISTTAQWTEVETVKSDTENFAAWKETTGYDSWQDWLAAEDAFVENSDLVNTLNFCTIPDDTRQFTIDSIRDVVVTASWKMVYAKDQAEFDSIWDQMIADCEGLGAQEIIDWRLADIENAKKIRDSLLA